VKRVGIVALIIAVVAFGSWHFIKATPQYSLFRFGAALKQHDADAALRYIDVDAVVDNHFRDVAKEMDAKSEKSQNPWEQIGTGLAKGLMNLMLPNLKEAAKSELRAAIEEPSSATEKKKFDPFKGVASWRDFDIEKQGKIALVTKRSDKAFFMKLSQTQDGHWKIVQLKSKEFKPELPKN
jgi:hypothetical protein